MRSRLITWLMIAGMSTGCATPPPVKITRPGPATPTPSGRTFSSTQNTPPVAPSSVPVVTPEMRAKAQAAQREATIATAKAATARDPMNWRVFNELGTVYYGQAMYDQAIAAFQQALALQPVTTTLENERKQQQSIDAQHAAEAEQQRVKAKYDQEAQSAAAMNDIFSSVLGALGSLPGADANTAAILPTIGALNAASSKPTIPGPVNMPRGTVESQWQSKREVAVIYANLGMAYFGKNSFPDAVASFDSAVQLDPSRTDVLKISADAQYRLCKYDECITTLTRYHAIATVEPGSMLLLSKAFHALGMEPEADKVFRSFLAKQNASLADPVKLMDLGSLCLSHCRYAEAAELLARARQAAQDSPATARRFAEAQMALLQTTNALALLEAEAEFGLLQPANGIARLRAVAQPQADARAWYMLGRGYDETGDRAKATEAYGRALEAFGAGGSDAPGNNYVEVCRAAAGKGDDAVKLLERRLAAVPLTPGGGAEQWCLLAFVYEKAGRIPESMEILSRCREVNPAYAKVGAALARLSKLVAAEHDRALAEAEAVLKSGDKNQAVKKMAEAYRLTAAGQKKEEIRKALLRMVSGMDPTPSMTNEALDHYLRGNAALKAAKSPMDLGRSLSEFQWAVFYSPWVGDLYFNTSAIKNLQNQTAAAVSDLKLCLAAKPGAKNVEEMLKRLYEFDYQREQKLRELASAASF